MWHMISIRKTMLPHDTIMNEKVRTRPELRLPALYFTLLLLSLFWHQCNNGDDKNLCRFIMDVVLSCLVGPQVSMCTGKNANWHSSCMFRCVRYHTVLPM